MTEQEVMDKMTDSFRKIAVPIDEETGKPMAPYKVKQTRISALGLSDCVREMKSLIHNLCDENNALAEENAELKKELEALRLKQI